MLTRICVATLILSVLLFLAGCANISLFSSKHEHYYDGKETQERLRNLEKKMEAIEQYLRERDQKVLGSSQDVSVDRSKWERLTLEPSPQIGKEAVTAHLKIKSFIDGADVIKIQANKIWYEHESWNLPGRWEGRNEPTFINEKEWIPEWEGRNSKPFDEIQPPLPTEADTRIYASETQGRGPVYVIERPNAGNDYVLSLYLDDAAIDGADWYEVLVQW
jgi:hypothetical protein